MGYTQGPLGLGSATDPYKRLHDNARGRTRTGKTRRSGDFESPASTNSTTRAKRRNVAGRPRPLNACRSTRELEAVEARPVAAFGRRDD
jgi:hypothetical protein